MKRILTAAVLSMLSACTIYFGDDDDDGAPWWPDAHATIDAPGSTLDAGSVLDATEPQLDGGYRVIDAPFCDPIDATTSDPSEPGCPG